MAVLAGLAVSCAAGGALAQAGDVAGSQQDTAVTAQPSLVLRHDPGQFWLPTPPVETTPGPYAPRGSVTLYASTTEPGSVVNFGTGGCPIGSGVQPDVCVDDIPIPAARLMVSGAVVSRISVCQVTVAVRQAVGAPATDVNAYWCSITNDSVAPDTDIDSPIHLITDASSPVSTLAGSPFLGQTVSRTVPANTTGALRTYLVTIGDGVNPIPGMSNIPLNMNYAVAGGLPATFGTLAIGTQIGETASNTNRWRFTTGPDASLNQFWIYDTDLGDGMNPCHTITTPETGPWSFGASPVSNWYAVVKGTPIAPTTPQTCCMTGTGGTVCVVTDGTTNCTQSSGTPLAGQTTCTGTPCTPIVCCNNTTGVCSTEFGTCPTGSGVLVSGQTSCATVTCTQPTPPANDECSAATAGSQFELVLPSTNPVSVSLSNQTLVGATVSAGWTGGVTNCTFADTDVWYLLTVPASLSTAQFKVTGTPTASSGDYTLQPVAVAVYDGGGGCPAAAGGELACADFSNPSTAYFTGTGSTSYYVRVAFFQPTTTKFTISASQVVIVACCSGTNGLCLLSDNQGNCSTAGYTTPAPGGATTCSPINPCPIGACCGAGGACSLSGPGGCANYQGDGTVCTPTNPCGGACCNATTFACDFTDSAGCGAGHTFQGNGSVCTTVGICPAPPNDNCPGVTLTLNNAVTGYISQAQGLDITSCSTSSVDVWYNFNCTTTGNYSIKATPATANDVGVALALYDTGVCDPVADTDIDCLPQPATGTATELLDTLLAGHTYLIRVGGFPGNNGQFSILVSQPAGLGSCCGIGAQCLIVASAADCPDPAVYNGVNTTCAAPATACPAGACCFPDSGQCFVTIQSFCVNHQHNANPGGWNGADTTCDTTSCNALTPSNDACTSAIVITSPTFHNDVGTELAQNEGLPAGACNSAAAQTIGANNSVWYTFTAPSNGVLNIQVNDWTGYDMFMSAFTGTCGALTEIGCFDDPEPFNVNATLANGTTIFLMISQWDVTAGGGWTSIDTTFSATGSCCVGSTCTAGVTQADCTGNSGTWNGANSTCAANTCVPAGVCCRGATCNTTVTQANCTTTGFLAGATFPAGPNCTGSSFTSCCYADYNKVNGTGVPDIFDFLNDWFASSPFANVGGNGNPAQLAVQNIFDFLNNWFAGCTP
ncbi:MAG TPA: hypothetical protein VHC70_12560 [Phycisphaerales bacterium]|nr:hypothetical protein [Phycisphaerales bacterium]